VYFSGNAKTNDISLIQHHLSVTPRQAQLVSTSRERDAEGPNENETGKNCSSENPCNNYNEVFVAQLDDSGDSTLTDFAVIDNTGDSSRPFAAPSPSPPLRRSNTAI
jgi:hypothetical protein